MFNFKCALTHADPAAREHRQLNSYITRMEREGVERVKMFVVVIVAYMVFWGPLFLVTLMTPAVDKPGLSHEVSDPHDSCRGQAGTQSRVTN